MTLKRGFTYKTALDSSLSDKGTIFLLLLLLLFLLVLIVLIVLANISHPVKELINYLPTKAIIAFIDKIKTNKANREIIVVHSFTGGRVQANTVRTVNTININKIININSISVTIDKKKARKADINLFTSLNYVWKIIKFKLF